MSKLNLLRNAIVGGIVSAALCTIGSAIAEETPAPATTEAPDAASTTDTASTETSTQASAETSASAAEVNEDGEKLICRYSKATGTRLKRVKSCFTKEEWARRTTNAGRAVDDMKDEHANTPIDR
jgi:hypothetical protein